MSVTSATERRFPNSRPASFNRAAAWTEETLRQATLNSLRVTNGAINSSNQCHFVFLRIDNTLSSSAYQIPGGIVVGTSKNFRPSAATNQIHQVTHEQHYRRTKQERIETIDVLCVPQRDSPWYLVNKQSSCSRVRGWVCYWSRQIGGRGDRPSGCSGLCENRGGAHTHTHTPLLREIREGNRGGRDVPGFVMCCDVEFCTGSAQKCVLRCSHLFHVAKWSCDLIWA